MTANNDFIGSNIFEMIKMKFLFSTNESNMNLLNLLFTTFF